MTAVCDFLPGQQMWCAREGSGEAGEAPACTTAAARGRMPVHAVAGWLTDHPSSVTIKTTPRDRLAITGKMMGRGTVVGLVTQVTWACSLDIGSLFRGGTLLS